MAGCIGEPIKKKDLYGADSMARSSAATSCVGTHVDIGVDDDQDGVLSDAEVDHAFDLCSGANGVNGIAGVDGKDGTDGADGAPGLAGADGSDGATGPQGEAGPTGATGAPGPAGRDGRDGVDGVDGAAGPAGPQGAPGATGAAGPAGADGKDGVNGADGRSGASAAFRQEPIVPGAECARGGTRLVYGTDRDTDGTLGSGEDQGAVALCSLSCGAYTCGGDCGTCEVGFACGNGACVDVDECLISTTCPADNDCANTVGSFTCTPRPPPEPVCSPSCGPSQACVAGVCVGSGQLRFSSTWSRPGDIDVWVTTPGGVSIGWQRQSADGGRQDRDDTRGQGPENIYWESTPPAGQYHVCVATNYIGPNAANPVTVTVTVARPMAPDVDLSATFTSSQAFSSTQRCSPEHPTYLGSVDVF